MTLGDGAISGNQSVLASRYAALSEPQQNLLALLALFSAPLLAEEAVRLCLKVAEHRHDKALANLRVGSDLLTDWVSKGFLQQLGPFYRLRSEWQVELVDNQLTLARKRDWVKSIEVVFAYEADAFWVEKFPDQPAVVQQRLDRRLSVALCIDDTQRLLGALQRPSFIEHLQASNKSSAELLESLRFKRYLKSWRMQFSVERLAGLSKSLQALIIHLYLGPQGDLLDMDEEMLAYMSQFMLKARYERQALLPRYMQYLLMMGKVDAIDGWLEIAGPNPAAIHTAWKAFLLNKSHETLAVIIAHQRVITKQKDPLFYIGGLVGVFYLLALMQRLPEQPELQEKFRYQIQRAVAMVGQQQDPYAMVQLYLHEIYRLYNSQLDLRNTNMLTTIERWLVDNQQHPAWPMQFLMRCLQACWLDEPLSLELSEKLLALFEHVDQHGSTWLATELAFVMDVLLMQPLSASSIDLPKSAFADLAMPDLVMPVVPVALRLRVKTRIADMQQKNGLPLVLLLPARARRQGARQSLEKWRQIYAAPESSDVQESRIIWVLGYNPQTQQPARTLMLKEQKRTRAGWSRGRLLNLKSVMEELPLWESLSLKDQQILKKTVRQEHRHQYDEYALDFDAALLQLVGQSNVYYEKRLEQPVVLVAKKPQLMIRAETALDKAGGEIKQIRILVEPHPRRLLFANESVALIPESGNGFQVIEFQTEHWRVADLLGKNGLLVPLAFKQQALQSINTQLSLFSLQSEVDDDDVAAEKISTDSRLHLLLTPIQLGLSVNVFVRPFGEFGPQFAPGQGAANLITEVEHRRFKTRRDLSLEKRELKALCNDAPSALDFSESSLCEVLGLEQAYEMLLYFQQQGQQLVLHWPKGKTLRLLPEISQQQLSLQVSAKQNWFELTGELKIDEASVYTLPQLSALMAKSASGRFIKLNDDSVLVLTEKLKRKLDQWRAYTDQGRFHVLASHAIEDMMDELPVVSSEAWQQQLARFAQAQTLSVQVPTTLRTQLRDYQKEGFQWLARLAHAGVGACLADDMGLGKTIQTLALLLLRASDGPALIVAPKSVCMNWLQEIKRFAPTFNVLSFTQFNGAQQIGLKKVAAFDLVVCSYGLLQSNLDQFSAVKWHTLVADEAQAIKNRQAKRTQAVISLTADFKLALTGTPIENHLGDLWSLFRFINPGLLGSLESFNQRFVLPIEQQREQNLQPHLQALIKPFLLRRLKRDVLTELPSRTEITVEVTLSEAEQALYEALRRQAVNSVANTTGSAGQKRLRVFAELMRLRRACCHPAMVLPEAGITSSKLEMLMTLVDELLQNQHKALVFSQFVDHLQLIKAELNQRGIAYQYLDGSTSTAHRQQAVNNFQAGQGDLFLISLKAGGVGLNLTAADYVIHMDPWWNPAVEDQASDRAHRIGQLRPVTIYRLVTVDTIEQKIMALHQQKRDLATRLLAGSDTPMNLSLEDMQMLLER
jgi:superfamily II DNA or RNA helicase